MDHSPYKKQENGEFKLEKKGEVELDKEDDHGINSNEADPLKLPNKKSVIILTPPARPM